MSDRKQSVADDTACERATAAWPAGQDGEFPLAQPVRVRSNGVVGVVTGISTCSPDRRRVSYFSRHFWAWRSFWTSIDNLERIPRAPANATDAAEHAQPEPIGDRQGLFALDCAHS